MKIGLYRAGASGPFGIKIGELIWDMCPRVGEKIVYDDTLWSVRQIAHVINDWEVAIEVQDIEGVVWWAERGRSE
jgi:hypothetical protein